MSTSVPSRRVWTSLFTAAGLPSDSISKYADIFASERLRLDLVVDLSRSELEELGITAFGDQLAVKRHAEKMLQDLRGASKADSDSDGDDSASETHSHSRRMPSKKSHDSDRKLKNDNGNKTRPKHVGSVSRAVHSKKLDKSDDDDDSSDKASKESYDADYRMDIVEEKRQVKSPSKSIGRMSTQRVRVVRTDETVERNESMRALRMLSMANSSAVSAHGATADDRVDDDFGRGKMRSDLMETRDKNMPPPDPVNGLSRLISGPSLEPVLIRSLKPTVSGNALKRLGPRSVSHNKGIVSPIPSDPKVSRTKKSALSRLDGGLRATVRSKNREVGVTEQRGKLMLRTIQGLAVGKPLSGRGSALERLGNRKEAAVGETPHPLSRC